MAIFFLCHKIFGNDRSLWGKDKFEAKLDEMFNSESKKQLVANKLMLRDTGQYAHGNEPSHHMAYLYNYIGKPEKLLKSTLYFR
jgi:putative alpha-1,2-mannosidase